MAKHPEEITVYRELGSRVETCSLGINHRVYVYEQKRLTLYSSYFYNNGYEKIVMPVYEDAQGRRYYGRQGYDYSSMFHLVRYTGELANRYYKNPELGLPAENYAGQKIAPTAL